MANQILTLRIPARAVTGILGDGSTYQRFSSQFSVQLSGLDSITLYKQFVGMTWTFSLDSILDTIDIASIISAKIEFYYQNADVSPIGEIEIVDIGTTEIASLSNADFYAAVNNSSTVYGTSTLVGNQKKRFSIDFDSLSTVSTRILSRQSFNIGFRKKEATNGTVLLGGMNMSIGEENPWEPSGSVNIVDEPVLIIECSTDTVPHPQHLLKYTIASEPGTNQSDPSRSLGGYISSNLVNVRVQLAEDISAIQTTIPIQSADELPEQSTGLIHVGSEICKYSSVDSDTNTVTSVKRGVIPAAYASIMQPFPEFVHYISVDNVFDTSPPPGLIQYRCLCIQQQSIGTSESWQTQLPKVILTQGVNPQAVVDIAIEVPKWDCHFGTFLESVTGGNEFTSNSTSSATIKGVINFEDGFFNGGHIVIDQDGDAGIGPLNHIIDSYEYDANTGIASFFLEDNLPNTAILAGTEFRINPAPAQSIPNESTAPSNDNGRFFGFTQDGGINSVVFEESGTTMYDYDVFYVWIKRTLIAHQKASSNTGALLTILSESV